jgi:hypothetical protein
MKVRKYEREENMEDVKMKEDVDEFILRVNNNPSLIKTDEAFIRTLKMCGIRFEELSEKLNIDPEFFYNVVKNKHIRPSVIHPLAKIIGVPLSIIDGAASADIENDCIEEVDDE